MAITSPEEVQTWLEWAGSRLIALPVPGLKPNEIKITHFEYSQDRFQILDFRGQLPLRAGAPSSAEIPIMDLILTLPALCAWQNHRRVLHLRALVHPISGRHLYTWAKLARKIACDPRTVKTWHRQALVEVTDKAPSETVCRISAFITPSP